jgi:VanZ family protein
VKIAVRIGLAIGTIAATLLAPSAFADPLNALFLRYPGIDKLLHVLGYGLVFVVVYGVAARAGASPRLLTPLAWAIGLSIALLDETVQGMAPARTVELFDLVANCAGLTLGWIATARPRAGIAAAAAVGALAIAGYVAWDTRVRLGDYSRGLQYSRQHDFVRAREFLTRAHASGLRSASLFNDLAWVEVESGVGDGEQAVIYARTALELRPGNGDVLDTYGWALHHAGRSAEGLIHLNEAYVKSPEMYCINYHLGVVYEALGQLADAEWHLRRQLEFRHTREAALAARALERLAARGGSKGQ